MDWGSLLGVLLGGALAAGGGYLAQRKAHKDALKLLRVENVAKEANAVSEGIKRWSILEITESLLDTGSPPPRWTGANHGLNRELDRLGFWMNKPDHVAAQIIWVRGDLVWMPEGVIGNPIVQRRLAEDFLKHNLILQQLIADVRAALSRLPFDGEDSFIRDVKASREKFKTEVSDFFHCSNS